MRHIYYQAYIICPYDGKIMDCYGPTRRPIYYNEKYKAELAAKKWRDSHHNWIVRDKNYDPETTAPVECGVSIRVLYIND